MLMRSVWEKPQVQHLRKHLTTIEFFPSTPRLPSAVFEYELTFPAFSTWSEEYSDLVGQNHLRSC